METMRRQSPTITNDSKRSMKLDYELIQLYSTAGELQDLINLYQKKLIKTL